MKTKTKVGVIKSEVARGRKIATIAELKEREHKLKEDLYWVEAEGAKSRAAKKREEEAEKRAEAAAKKAEARRLAEHEEKELARSLKKKEKVKVTEAELLRRKEEEKEGIRRKVEEETKRTKRILDEKEYERTVCVANVNRVEELEARTVEDAIEQLAECSSAPVVDCSGSILVQDMLKLEKRRKAMFLAFQEAEMPLLKKEKPGLTLNQYKDMVWKMWKKSPKNLDNHVKSISATTELSSGPVVSERKGNQKMKARH